MGAETDTGYNRWIHFGLLKTNQNDCHRMIVIEYIYIYVLPWKPPQIVLDTGPIYTIKLSDVIK